MAKPIRALELHYPMIQVLIIKIIQIQMIILKQLSDFSSNIIITNHSLFLLLQKAQFIM